MKKSEQKSANVKTGRPNSRTCSFAYALLAGLVLTLPVLAAPLPTPCAGSCGPSANLPFVQAGTVAAPVTSGNTMTINQSSPTAILNWQNFNIGNGNSVNFVQPSTTASALNRVWDVNANPSIISGALNANGQIYLINQNGIVFNNGAQVNAGALIASSLDINDGVYQKGYLANNTATGSLLTPIFFGSSGFIRVDTGAVLNGSRIMMFAPVVENNGSIATTDGQAVLAAGHKVYLEASQDPNLRGVLVEVDVNNPGVADTTLAGQKLLHTEAGTVTNTGGTIDQMGGITANRGNVTLVGFAVNQQGRVSATTSVTQNGSIKLLARHAVEASTLVVNSTLTTDNQHPIYDIRAKQTGTVTLAKGSVTQVTPETSDASTTTDGQGFNPSIVEVMGKTVNVQGSIIAPGGKVNLVATGSIDPTVGSNTSGTGIYQEINPALSYSSFLNPNYKPIAATDGARVFLDNGSLIDVSGSTASVSVARNILAVQLRGSQLADAPLQKNGFLWGKTVYIDLRKGSTLANYAGDEAQIARTVAERTSAGGQVLLASTGDVVMNPAATINVSGGQVNYTGDYIGITTLISKGVAYDIAQASPNLIYDAVGGKVSVTHGKWGITESWDIQANGNKLGAWDPGYVEGKAAGSVTVLAPNAALQGKILANNVTGIYQRQPYADPATLAVNNYQNTWRMLPKGGTLSIGYGQAVKDVVSGQYNFLTNADVVVQANPQQTNYTLGDVLSSTLPVVLSAGLFSSNLSNLAVYTNGIASIDAGTALVLAPGGSVKLQGGRVNMLGSINSSGGSVSLGTVVTTNPLYNATNPNYYLKDGAITVGGNVSTRGTWVNDSAFFGVPDTSRTIVVNGGNISFNSGAALIIEPGVKSGVILDASGGGWVDQSGKVHGGNGGNISLAGNTIQATLDKVTFNSYGVDTGKGGSFKLAAGDVQIGGIAQIGTQFLPAVFFQSGGFSAYTVAAQGIKGLNVDGLIQPRVQSLILNRDAVLQASGTDIYALSNPGLLPDWQRNPASITLAQTGVTGAVVVSANAQIQVDPKASITLNAANQLTVLGTLDAPAGTINLNLNSASASYVPTQSIWLGSSSRLLATGYFQQAVPNPQKLVLGQVLAGGRINITTSNGGYVIAQQGSLMDVSGASANLDLPQLQSGSLVYRSTHVAGDAGAIAVQAGEGALFDGNMKAGIEAGSSAAAGSFSLALNNDPELTNPSTPPNPGAYPLAPAQIQVMASGNGNFATQAGLVPVNDANAGLASLTAIAGKALLDASALQKSGFDQVKLKSDNAIILADQVNLQTRRNITLDTPQFVVNGSSKVSSAQVMFGNLNSDSKLQVAPSPTAGPVAGANTLNVSGQFIDLKGNFTVSGANQVMVSSGGDIRLDGIFNPTGSVLTGNLRTQGNITLQAAQVYPSTLAQFKLSVEDGSGASAGNITIQQASASSSLPVLSAGGQLTLGAANIVQNGTLKAPLGTLNLNGSKSVTLGAGSLTSVSAEGQTIPFGLIQGGNAWYYDLTGQGTLVSMNTPPQKTIKLGGPGVTVAQGATIDLSGGGDLYAYEFFAGSGGSVNVLDPGKAAANTYAILPGMTGYAPYDPQYAGQYSLGGSKTTLQPGSSVYLAGGAGLAAGYYTLLPASYALLPGAYRVTAVSGYGDRQPGQGVTTLLDGTQIMAGKFAVIDPVSQNAFIQDARYSGFAVSPGSVVRTQSEFHDSYANSFFAAQAAASGNVVPLAPLDAGQLVISATGANALLKLDGTFITQPGQLLSGKAVNNGKGAQVDFNGPGFAIVNKTGSGPTGMVELTTAMLDAMGVESLLIGGTRTQAANGISISVGANNVVVDNGGAILSGAEILLAANNAITVKAGSSLLGTGNAAQQQSNLILGSAGVSGDGALLRVSSGAQANVIRNNSTGATGDLVVENGASISASNAVLLDASHTTSLGGNTTLSGKALGIAAGAIDIGNGSSSPAALSLSSALLGQLQSFNEIALHSYSDINFYGQASLGGKNPNGGHLINKLVMNALSLNGIGNASGTIDTGSITLLDSNVAALSALPNGSGALQLNADSIVLGSGAKNIRGFDSVAFNAAQINQQGKGSLTLASASTNPHQFALQGTLGGAAQSDQTINAAAYDAVIQAPAIAAASGSDIGAKLTFNAKSISDAGNINLPAGTLTLHAVGTAVTDGIVLDKTSRTGTAGIVKSIGGQDVYAPAGVISLSADNGSIDIRNGATVDVSGTTTGGDAGSINIAAAKGTVAVAGNLKGAAAPGYVAGSFILDVSSLSNSAGGAGNALTVLDDTLTAGGFTSLRDMRVRAGNLAIDADVAGAKTFRASAQTFRLAADAGNIDVSGTVDASGANGGNILLVAKNNLTLNAGALLDAHATATAAAGIQDGGKVALETSNGVLELNNQRIDVHGSNGGGSVLVRAPRNAANTDVALNNTGGAALNVNSGATVTVEAFKSYTSTGTLAAADVATISLYNSEATAFAANATAIKTRLGMLNAPNLHLTPGIEIVGSGDLTLTTDWDLSGWRYNDGNGGVTEPGILTLKAAGNLNFGTTTVNATTGAVTTTTASLSDGFISATSFALLLGGNSWSYRLVAGADSASANPLAVNGTGNVTLASGNYNQGTPPYTDARGRYHPGTPSTTSFDMVRTGTGFIDMAAGGGLYLGNSNAMIYTAGQQAPGLPASLVASATKAFATGGGDINIAVKGDISAIGLNGTGSAVNKLASDWLWRQGSLNANGSFAVQPAWWVDFGSFVQNIGALGGGSLNINAGGNITSLSVAVPSTGYVATPGSAATLLSGGNLNVKAGADINSGIFYVGNGQGNIRAGGSLGTSRFDANGGNVALYTILALGQGNIDVRTGGDLNLQTILNPTILGSGSKFFTYGDSSGVSLESLNGNILLSNDTRFYAATPAYVGNLATSSLSSAASPYINPGLGKTDGLTVYPGSLSVAALNGGINSRSSMTLLPSARGSLQFLAGADINFTGFLTMSDVSPALLQPAHPVYTYSDTVSNGHGVVGVVPLHSGDLVPAIIAANGSIVADNTSPDTPVLSLPKPAKVQAGQDIKNLSLYVQNIQDSDTSSVTAGRDIVYTPNVTAPSSSTVGITVAGPGQFVMQAGHNIDLGQSAGIVTKGNLDNPYLPADGASITVLAGAANSGPGLTGFIQKYIDPAAGKGYTPELVSYIAKNLDPSTKAGQANLPVLLSYFFDPATNIGQANRTALADFIGKNGAPQRLTAEQSYTYLKSLPVSLQSGFAFSFFNAQTTSDQAKFVSSATMQGYAPDLVSFVNNHGVPTASAADAYIAFNKMPVELQRKFADQVLFSELKQSGRSATGKVGYQRGFDAIAALFPAGNYQGDINLYYSQIKTMRGGGIDLLAPGGGVNAGLANPSATGPQKSASQLGIVTVKGGDVNAFVNNDFMVNQSRVFTLQGGNILMWSSAGNIDAGKGSKSVSSTPPPLLVVDPKTGAFNVDVTQSVVGSGIRVLLANKNVVPGSVDLFAPSGEINAGDAGIGAAGNIFLGALRVVGADNINFGGTSVGVPLAAPAPVHIGGFGNMQDAAAAAEQATQNMNNASEMAKKSLANFRPTFLSVEVIGLGNESMSLQQ